MNIGQNLKRRTKRMGIKDFLILQGEGKEKAYYIDHIFCEKCDPFDGSNIVLEDVDLDIEVQYFCSGFMPYIQNPKDDHEKFNRVRCCIVGQEKITIHEWTPWEAHRVGVSLSNISAQFLLKDQPGDAWKAVEKILKKGDKAE